MHRIDSGRPGASFDEGVIYALDMIMVVNDLKLQAEVVKQKYISVMSGPERPDPMLTEACRALYCGVTFGVPAPEASHFYDVREKIG